MYDFDAYYQNQMPIKHEEHHQMLASKPDRIDEILSRCVRIETKLSKFISEYEDDGK